MARHPYSDLPRHQFWTDGVATPPGGEVDPVVSFPFRLTASDKVATAGSCFAQHISRSLSQAGYNYFVAEPAPPVATPKVALSHNYGVFSARFGNVYTTRQLVQLFERAYGTLAPEDQAWRSLDGSAWVDPFRPRIQPGGFVSVDDLQLDRKQHLRAVRTMFETLDVFVFTLGLTEGWRRKSDGAVFPLCPGVAGGAYDPALYEFHNFTIAEVMDDLSAFLGNLKTVNPGARTILTVSPVPLVATYEPRHVLVSTTYSKSVLRVACDEAARAFDGVAYFPSYEIVAGHHARGRFFEDDLREVREDGVEQVMSLFMRHCTDARPGGLAGAKAPGRVAALMGVRPRSPQPTAEAKIQKVLDLVCDEEALDGRRDDAPAPSYRRAATRMLKALRPGS